MQQLVKKLKGPVNQDEKVRKNEGLTEINEFHPAAGHSLISFPRANFKNYKQKT